MQSRMFVPPPYPFPERWRETFASAPTTPWLTPFSAISHSASISTWHPSVQPAPDQRQQEPLPIQAQDQASGSEESDSADEYEYAFELSDEWRAHFSRARDRHAHAHTLAAATTRNQQLRPRKSQPKAQRKTPLQALLTTSRASDSTRTRRISQRYPDASRILAMEAQLRAQFDAVCASTERDLVLWPSSSA